MSERRIYSRPLTAPQARQAAALRARGLTWQAIKRELGLPHHKDSLSRQVARFLGTSRAPRGRPPLPSAVLHQARDARMSGLSWPAVSRVLPGRHHHEHLRSRLIALWPELRDVGRGHVVSSHETLTGFSR